MEKIFFKTKSLKTNRVQFNDSLNHAINDFDILNETKSNSNKSKLKRKSINDSINLIDTLIDCDEAETVPQDLIDDFDIDENTKKKSSEKKVRVRDDEISVRATFKKPKLTRNDDLDTILDHIELRDENQENNVKISLNYKIDKNGMVNIQPCDSILKDETAPKVINTRPKSFSNSNTNARRLSVLRGAVPHSNEVDEEIDSLSLEELSKQKEAKLCQKGTEWLSNLNTRVVKEATEQPQQPQQCTDDLLFHTQKNPKFVKNGFANQLKALLEREKSAINFNKHLLKKDKLNKNSTITVLPYRTEIFHNYIFVVYARDIRSNEKVMILFSKSSLDLETFKSKMNENSLLHVYPPWHRVTLTIENETINAYFCVNLYKLVEKNALEIRSELTRGLKIDTKTLKCGNCGQNVECESYFDYKKLFNFKATTRTPIVNTQMALFSQFNIIQSQEINFSNSILDSLEETGYFGNVSFQAVVQRLFKTRVKPSNMLRRWAFVSDKYNMFAQIWIPFELDIKQSFKYDFKSLKLIEKCVPSSCLESQIAHLWTNLTKSESNYPKIIYVFEFDFCASRVEQQGKSRAYVELKTIDVLVKKKYERFKMENVLILLLNALNVDGEDVYELYVIDFSREMFKFQLSDLSLCSEKLLLMMSDGYAVAGSVCNFSYCKDGFILDDFSSVEARAAPSQDFHSLLDNYVKAIDSDIKINEFSKITGKIMNIVESECYIILKCLNCGAVNDLVSHENNWFCNSCRRVTTEPDFKLSMQLVLNCINVTKLVKIKPHFNTIRELLNIKDELCDLNETIFDAGSLLDREIGPLYAFIYKTNDNEIYAKEIRYEKE